MSQSLVKANGIIFEVPGEPVPWTVYTRRGPPPPGFLAMQAWQEQIQAHMRHRWGNREPLSGPVTLYAAFYRGWPRSAPQKDGGAISRWYNKHIIMKPDTTNYLKAFEDALIGIVFLDDAQTLDIRGHKDYASPGVSGYTVVTIDIAPQRP